MDSLFFQKPDLHMHSTFSDGTETPPELLAHVKKEGIDLFSLTDHDAYAGCLEILARRSDDDPAFLTGIEFSCRDRDGKYHILGYGYDPAKESIRNAVNITHGSRIQKVSGRLSFLRQTYGFTFTAEEVDPLNRLNNPGKPHIATLMVARGYARDTAHAFELMKGYKGDERYLSPLEAIDAILHADGIPVLAHGPLGEGSQTLTDEEVERRVSFMKEYGLMGLECYYSGFSDEQVRLTLSLAQRYGLFVTAGSDYHGTNKTVRLADTGCVPNPERMSRFYAALRLMGKI